MPRLTISGIAPPSIPFDRTRAVTSDNNKGEKILLIVGRIASPNGVRVIETSNPQITRLGPRWIEVFNRRSRRESSKVVKIRFPEEDVEAMTIVVLAAHDRFDALPRTITLQGLVQLALVAERYDLNHLFVGHIGPWLAPHRERVAHRGYEKWLYVMWQFGLERDYLALTDHLAVVCEVDAEQQLLLPDTKKHIVCRLPNGALDAIAQIRIRHVLNIWNLAYDFGEKLMITNTCKLADAPQTEQDLCTAHNSLGYNRYLRHHGILPRPENICSIRVSIEHTLRILCNPAMGQFIKGEAGADQDSSTPPLARSAILRRHDKTCCVAKDLFRLLHEPCSSVPCTVEADIVSQIKRNAERMGHTWRIQNMAQTQDIETKAGSEVEMEEQERDAVTAPRLVRVHSEDSAAISYAMASTRESWI